MSHLSPCRGGLTVAVGGSDDGALPVGEGLRWEIKRNYCRENSLFSADAGSHTDSPSVIEGNKQTMLVTGLHVYPLWPDEVFITFQGGSGDG